MKTIKQKDPRYPIKVVFNSGRYLQLVLQRKLKSGSCLRRSGCSIISEYEALQWLGRHDKDVMPTYLLAWHRKHTPQCVRGKLTMRGVNIGINHFGKGLCTTKFYKPEEITLDKVKKLLRAGCLIVFEHKAPHTFLLAYDNGKFWLLDKGKAKVANLPVLVARKNKTKTYGGMIAITPTKTKSSKGTTTSKATPKKQTTKTQSTTTKKKSIETIVKEVREGKWGDYPERKRRLIAAGYDYRKIQNIVNELEKKK